MKKKYFGTDGIRGKVNNSKINGEMFFKFGLAAGTYFKNLKKKKTNRNYCKGHQIIWLHLRTSIGFWTCLSRNACIYPWTVTNKWISDAYKKNESQSLYNDYCLT